MPIDDTTGQMCCFQGEKCILTGATRAHRLLMKLLLVIFGAWVLPNRRAAGSGTNLDTGGSICLAAEHNTRRSEKTGDGLGRDKEPQNDEMGKRVSHFSS